MVLDAERPWIASWGDPVYGEGDYLPGPHGPLGPPCLFCARRWIVNDWNGWGNLLTFGANDGYLVCRRCAVNNWPEREEWLPRRRQSSEWMSFTAWKREQGLEGNQTVLDIIEYQMGKHWLWEKWSRGDDPKDLGFLLNKIVMRHYCNQKYGWGVGIG